MIKKIKLLIIIITFSFLTGCATTEPWVSFGYYEKYPSGRHYHTGIDIDQPRGTPILAAANGTVTRSQTAAAYSVSKAVTIDHGDDISSDYQHMDSVLVKVGQRLRRGEVIGTVGTSGGQGGYQTHVETAKPHLHFEVLKRSSSRDPKSFIVGCFDPKRTYAPLEMIWPTGCP